MLELGIYRHFKGNEYEVIEIGTHTETHEQLVVYRALHGEHKVWVRPLVMFMENVDKDGYKGPRFVKLS